MPPTQSLTILSTLKRVLPDPMRQTDRRLDVRSRHRLAQAVEAVRNAVELYEPCAEFEMASILLITAEMWIGRAPTPKGDS